MPNSKIYKKISKHAGCNWQTVKNVLTAYSIFLEDELLENRRVWLPKIGHFELKYHGKIHARDVVHGGEMLLPERLKLVFKVSPKLKKFVQNSPFLNVKL